MSLTTQQLDATQRRTLYGVVYALSGTIPSRVGAIADGRVRWSTRSVPSGSGPLAGDEFEPYMVLPHGIERELAFNPTESAPVRPINIAVRNLPFRHKEGLVAAVVDEDYAWEGAEASLWVAYLKPGQGVGDLSPSDWEAVRLRGTFGSPRSISSDGFTLPLHSRDVYRRQKQLTTVATSGQFPNIDPTDEGKVIPIVVGQPGSTYRTLRVNAGLYGLARGWSAGATSIQVNTPFSRSQWQARANAGASFFIAREEETRQIQGVSGTEGSQILTLGLVSAMDFSAADGALIQEQRSTYDFLMNRLGISDSAGDETYPKAFIGLDGRLIPIDDGDVIDLTASSGSILRLSRVPAIRPNEAVSGGVTVTKEEVTQQPSFSTTATQTLSSKLNYPTGSTGSIGVNHQLARDGNENTGASLQPGELVTLTFNSAPSPFEDEDTTASTLHVICQGKITFRNAIGTVTYATTNVIGKAQFRFTQASPRLYDADITCVADNDGNGAVIYEAWWEHDLSEAVEIDQDQEVQIDVDIDSNFPSADTLSPIAGIAVSPQARNLLSSPWSDAWPLTPDNPEQNPATIFASVQALLVEGEDTPFTSNWGAYINSGSYDRAKERFEALGVSGQGFVITKPMTWGQFETQLAAHSRCHAFYGSSGHELVVMETAETLEAEDVVMEFRLPGVPNPNTSQAAGAPIMERGNSADVVNTVSVHWDRDWLRDTSNDPGQLYRRQVSGVHSDSASVYGERVSPEGAMTFWSWGIGNGPGTRAVVSGIAQFYADRFAFGVTRFTFETGHHAARLGLADIIRVAFAAAEGVYRNAPCVVESIRRSPVNGERFIITARAIGPPRKGLTFALTWEDLFVQSSDKWHRRITGRLDRWSQYWAVRG